MLDNGHNIVDTFGVFLGAVDIARLYENGTLFGRTRSFCDTRYYRKKNFKNLAVIFFDIDTYM